MKNNYTSSLYYAIYYDRWRNNWRNGTQSARLDKTIQKRARKIKKEFLSEEYRSSRGNRRIALKVIDINSSDEEIDDALINSYNKEGHKCMWYWFD